jgi:hypothetical protein
MSRCRRTSPWLPTWQLARSQALRYADPSPTLPIALLLITESKGTHCHVSDRLAQGTRVVGRFSAVAQSSAHANASFLHQTRMQVVSPTPAAVYTGIGNAIATISRVEGYASLWRGVSSVVVGAGMEEERFGDGKDLF